MIHFKTLVHAADSSLSRLDSYKSRRLKSEGLLDPDDESNNNLEQDFSQNGTHLSEQKRDSKHLCEALMKLEALIINPECDSTEADRLPVSSTESNLCLQYNSLPILDDLEKVVLSSQSLKSYIRLLPFNRRRVIVDNLYCSANESLCQLLKFDDAQCFFHESIYDGFGHVFKTARAKLPANKQTVFLSSALAQDDLFDYFKTELFCNDVVQLTPLSKASVATDCRLDVGAFESRLETSAAADPTGTASPLLVVACVGSFLFGHNDLVSKLLELRSRYRFWLHLIGLNLAALIATDAQEHLQKVIQSADSFTMPLNLWLGVRALPYLTVCKSSKSAVVSETLNVALKEAIGFETRLSSLPWWVAVQQLGSEGMKQRIDYAYDYIKLVLKCLSLFDNQLHLLGWGQSTAKSVLEKIEAKLITPPSVLTFRYEVGKANNNEDVRENSGIDDDYISCLNVWLAQGLNNEFHSSLSLQIVDMASGGGNGIRVCPLESSAPCRFEDPVKLDQLNKCLESMLNILNITVRCKRRLKEFIKDRPDLISLNIPKWAGVTGLVYIPKVMLDSNMQKPTDNVLEWSEQQRNQISHLNIELVRSLRNTDRAFSIGECGGVNCVNLGMLADECDLPELIKLVAEKGSEVEESSKYIEALAKVVKQGIEAANEDMKRESELRLINEGILRHVPLVGSVMNWWSPLPKSEGSQARGRAFDLVTGSILPTDAIFGKPDGSPALIQPPIQPPAANVSSVHTEADRVG